MLNILIVKLSAIGDVIHCLPVAAALKKSLPDARICWLVEAASAELLLNNPCVDEVIIFGAKRWVKESSNPMRWLGTFVEAQGFFEDLRGRNFDAVLEMQGLLKSSLVAFATGAKIRIGFAETREFADRFLTHKVNVGDYFGHYVPVVELNLAIVDSLLAVLGRSVREKAPEFFLPPLEVSRQQRVEQLLQPLIEAPVRLMKQEHIQNDVLVVSVEPLIDGSKDIHIRNADSESNLNSQGGQSSERSPVGTLGLAPGAELVPSATAVPAITPLSSNFKASPKTPRLCAIIPGTTWMTKIWPEEKWIELCKMLSQRSGYKLVLIGSKGEREINSSLVARLKKDGIEDILDLTGQTSLLDLASLFERCELVVGGDTGPLHLAAATGKPKILGIYGSTPWRRNGPYGKQCLSVSLETWCQPCYAKTCALKTVACLNELGAERVFAAICELMKRDE